VRWFKVADLDDEMIAFVQHRRAIRMVRERLLGREAGD
jgi:hypothetical protein